MIAEKVAKTMLALAGKTTFPDHDKEWWVSFFSQPDKVEQMLSHIASCMNSREEDMCKLVHMMYDHIKDQYENLR